MGVTADITVNGTTSKYKIEVAGQGTAESPYALSKGEDFAKIKSINLGKCYAFIPSFFLTGGHSIESVNGGDITNGDLNGFFEGCVSLKSFTSRLNNATDCGGMFSRCSSLENFSIDMPNLTIASTMFDGCSSLRSFNSNLSSLTNTTDMFKDCTSLTSVKITTTGNNAAIFTKANLGLGSSVRLYVNGSEVTA